VTKLARLRKLSPRDFALLMQLVALCCVVSAALRAKGWQPVSRMIVFRSRSRWLRRFPLLHFGYTIDSLNPLADMASWVCPSNRCLVRSMVLLWLLHTRGEPAEVVLGVRKRAGIFEAHAWTVSERGVVGDRPEAIEEFETLMTSGKSEL
jgi:Transglutaminase-like superfamily